MSHSDMALCGMIVMAGAGMACAVDTTVKAVRRQLTLRRQAKAKRAMLAKWARRARGTVRMVAPRHDPDADPLPALKAGNQVIGYAVATGAVVLIELPPAIPQVYVGPDGVAVYGGWSEAELIEIAARPSEFASDLRN